MMQLNPKAVNKITSNFLKRVLALFFCATLISLAAAPVFSHAEEKENKTVRVGWYEASYCYTDRFGRKTGMAYDYQQKVATYTGWTYEYVEGTWPELMEMLINGEIDLLSDVSRTPERAESVLYPSLPMGTESYYIYVNPDNTDLLNEDAASFDGKTFAVNKGSIQKMLLESWAEENGLSITILDITDKNAEETIDLLTAGIIDAFVSLDTYVKKPECVPTFKIGSSDYYFAVTKNRPDLLKELDHALKVLQNEDPFYNQELYQKYIWSVDTGIVFTKDERDYLAGRDVIKVGYRDNYQPFCYQVDGETSGALKDYLEQASISVEGMEINYEAVPFATTEEAIDALNRGEIDAVFPVSMDAYDSEVSNLFITAPVMQSEIYAVVRTGEEKEIFKDVDTTVALLSGNVNFDNFVKDYFPDWDVIWKPTLDEVYASVSSGEADCTLVNGYRLNSTDRLRRINKLSLLDTGETMEFSFAVKRENGILFSVLDKTANIIEKPTVDTMLSKYTNTVTRVSFYDYLRDNILVVVAVTLMITGLILLLLLNKIKADNTARQRQQLILATELDSLTRLYTRNFFFEYASKMYKENPDREMDAIIMNIEQFHVVNALYGWDFGDIVLKALGDEITKFIRESDGIACRTQADRFDIYCRHMDSYQEIIDRFQKTLDEVSQNVSIRLRMGVMLWQKGLEPVQLFDRARSACNMIRGSQRTSLMVFNEEMRAKELLEQRLINDLKPAIENREFLVYYQPKYNIQADPPRLESAEALVRWKHHEFGMVPPNEFIPLFEKTCQIGLLDRYVWKEAAEQIAAWKEKYGRIIPVSVNLSRIDIFDPDLINTIEELVQRTGIGRENLHLEVTESAYTEGEDQILEVIGRLRELGYHIEMDDFGTGYSSLNMLSHMSIDVLKLDRSFIKDLEHDTDGRKVRMVELILDIAESLKLTVVAEGVETKPQLDFLKERGCGLVQGFYFSKPLPAGEFEAQAFH